MALSGPHAETSDAYLTALRSRSEGLTTAEAVRRLAEHGPNQLPEAQVRKSLQRFLAQFHNVLIYVLMETEQSVSRLLLEASALSVQLHDLGP